MRSTSIEVRQDDSWPDDDGGILTFKDLDTGREVQVKQVRTPDHVRRICACLAVVQPLSHHMSQLWGADKLA